MRSAFRVGCVLALWVLLLPGLAAAQPWTAVGSSGIVTPSGGAPIHTIAGPFLQYGVASNSPITAYYNVTAVAGAMPFWTFMEMNATIAGGTGATVTAVLYRSARCGTGMPQTVCTVSTSTTGCFSCTLPGFLDFNNYEYYVMVTLQRTTTATGWPSLRSLRIE
jgi:hypothetical protein